MEHCGIDLHAKSSEVAVVDEKGALVETARIPTTESGLRRWFGGREPMRICIEAGGLSAWAERILRDLGHEVVVANPARVRLIAESTLKNDKVDAETLARLVRMDVKLLQPIRHRSETTQRLRAMLRARRTLVNARTACLNTTRGVLRSFGYRTPAHSARRLAQALDAGRFRGDLAAVAAPLVAMAIDLDAKIGALDDEVITVGKGYPEVARLQTVPGVGPLVALAFVLCLESPGRFPKSRDVAAFIGLRPRMRESGERSHFGRITRHGDEEMRRLLVQAAHACLRTRKDSDLKGWAQRLAARVGTKKAIVALARKLAVVMHRLWISGGVFEPHRQVVAKAA